MPLTEDNLARISKMRNVTDVVKYEAEGVDPNVFPQSPGTYPWNADNFGPLWIPSKGATVQLTEENLPLYRRIIEIYEGNSLEVKNGVIYINGKPASKYTFGMDYYFMMGDNRHNSADSRFWGFVPEDHIGGQGIGRVVFDRQGEKIPEEHPVGPHVHMDQITEDGATDLRHLLHSGRRSRSSVQGQREQIPRLRLSGYLRGRD